MKNWAQALAPLLIIAASALPATAEAPAAGLTFSFTPGLAIPVGSGADYFSIGGGAELLLEYPLALIQGLSLRGGLGYGFSTLQYGAGTTSEVSALAGAAWGFPIVGGLSARFFAGTGYSFGFVNGDSLSKGGGSPVLEAGAGLSYAVSRLIALRLETSYLYYVGAYGSLDISVGTAVSLPGTPSPAPTLPAKPAPLSLEITQVSLGEIFPVLLSSFSTRPFGTAVVRNAGSEPLTGVRVSFLARDSRVSFSESPPIPVLEPGQSQEVPLYAQFNASLNRVDRPISLNVEVRATASRGEEQFAASRSALLHVSGRSRVPWSDPRTLAAFIQPQERAVQDLSGLAAEVATRQFNSGLDRTLQTTIALLGAGRAAGVTFAPDSQAPYSLAFKDAHSAGTLKYPGQTLRSRVGDQPDLVVLYASLFESAGIETAILTTPGHMLLAVRIGVTQVEADWSLRGLPGPILRNGAVWIPLDVSARGGELLAAWEGGARIWGKPGAGPSAAFIPVSEARASYRPLDGPSPHPLALAPSADVVARAFTRGLAPIVDRQWNAAAIARRPMEKGKDAVQETATPGRLRLLLSVGTSGDAAYSDMDSLSIEKSIALALGSIDGLTVIESGQRLLSGDKSGLAESAQALGADSWLRAEISGTRSAPVVRVQLYDLGAKAMRVDRTVSPEADLDARGAARERWEDLVASVARTYPTVSAANVRPAEGRGILLTLHALPGTRITGSPGGLVVAGPAGIASLRLPESAACTLRAELAGYFPAEHSVFIDADRELYLPQEPMFPLSLETGFQNAFSPSVAAVVSFIPEVAFLRLGFTTFGFALALDGTQAVRSIPLWNLSLQAGLYFQPVNFPVRFYGGFGPFLRIVQLSGTAFRTDPLSPGGLQAAVGAEVKAGANTRLFIEYAPLLYWSAFPDLLEQSFPASQTPAGYIFTPVGAVSLIDIRFGVRWLL